MAAKVCAISLDEETVRRLDMLVKMSSVNTNKSKVLRELIDKEYISRMEN